MGSPPPPPVRADLRGRTCVVTGASSGIGRETARQLAGLGAQVVMAGRHRERLEEARAAVAGSARHARVEVALVDLARQASIRAFAAELAARHPRLDVLVNNAGTWSSRRRLSPDGIELTWATNVLAYHLTLALLLPCLRRAEGARVVNVASRLARGLDLGDVEYRRRRYSGVGAYAQSKQADRLLSWAWARRLGAHGKVTVNALHPGTVNTPLFGKGGGVSGVLGNVFARLRGCSVAQGADTSVWLAASPEAAGLHGAWVVGRVPRRCRFGDPAAEDALFELCEDKTGRPAAAVLA